MGFLTNAWNTFLVVTSVVLLAYWFRYTCLFILGNSPVRSFAGKIAAANQLNYATVQAQLARPDVVSEPDRLRELLDRDYRLLCYLIEHGSHFRTAGYKIERRVLQIDFKMMQIAYTLSRRLASSRSHQALCEMADIIGHLANSMGKEASLATLR